MTTVDTLIPYYYWFKSGFGEISLPMALVNLAMLITTLLTVKGIYIPLWVIPVIAVFVIGGCVFVGWFMQTYEINSRINSLVNQKQNPEIKSMHDDMKLIKKHLGLE